LAKTFVTFLNDTHRSLYDEYLRFVDSGIAREIARIGLPLSLYTQWYWKIDLHNLFHFLKLRLDEHAQAEIREYANAMSQMVKSVVPVSWEAFEDYQLKSVAFSALELRYLQNRLQYLDLSEETLVATGLSKGEAGEFCEKLNKIGKLS
jgi:thymidylate synthase (FAD)